MTTAVEEAVVDHVPEKLAYQPALDGLRGVAVLLVVLYHDGLLRAHPGGLVGGFLGVDVFFVLSGYLITSLLLIERASTGHIALRSFWARRARRLLPALFLLLLGVAWFSATIAAPTDLSQIRGDAIATLLYAQNWHLVVAHTRSGTGAVLDHTWSLSVEEQWYAAWPVLVALLLAWKRVRPSRILAAVVGMVAVFSVWTYVVLQNGRHIYYGTDARAPELLVGATLAVLLRYYGSKTTGARTGIEVLGLAGCLAAAAIVITTKAGSTFLGDGGSLVLAVAVAAVIAAAVQPASRIVRPMLSFHPLRLLGLVSYGLYLYHWPMFFWLSGERLHLSGVTLSLVRIAASIAVAAVSYVLIERPIRHGALRGVKLAIVAPVALAAVVVATLVTTRAASSNLIAPSAVNSLERQAVLPGRRVLVVGHGLAFQLQVTGGAYRQNGLNATATGFIDCSFIAGDIDVPGIGHAPEAPHCDKLQPSLRTLRDAFHPDVVVVIPGSQELFDRGVGPFALQVGSAAWTTYATSQLDAEIRALTTSDQTRIVVTSVPCDAAPRTGSAFDAVTYSTERHQAVSRFFATYANTHRATVSFADVNSVLCSNGAPIQSVGGAGVTDSHGALTRAGAHDLWVWIAQQVTGRAQ